MHAGELHGTSAAIGELTAEVRNLNSQCGALFRKFDEHVKEDREMHGGVKQLAENMRALSAAVSELKTTVGGHEALKNRVIGAAVIVGTVSGGIGAVAAKIVGG
jgi:phage-related minor tail protein